MLLCHNDRWELQAESFLFARFENAPSESEEVDECQVDVLSRNIQHPENASTSQPVAAAFDNPMYENTKVRNFCASGKVYRLSVHPDVPVGDKILQSTSKCCVCRIL
jgi:hypothetical protein